MTTVAFLSRPTLGGSSLYEKARKLRALLLSGGEAALDNVGRVFDVVKFFYPISCGCDDSCEELVVLQDCLQKQGQFVSATQPCELCKHLDIAEVFFKRS